MKSILLALDFTDTTGVMVETALTVAKAFDAFVHILHADPPDKGYIVYNYLGFPERLLGFFLEPPAQVEMEHAHILQDETHALETISDQFKAAGVASDFRLIENRTTAAILSAAKELEADLLVIGNHRHSLLRDLITGSVEHSLVTTAQIPILVVPTHS